MIKPVTFFLLRGLARETRHWVDFPEALEATGEKNMVFPLEILGAGRLRNKRSPLRPTEYIPSLRQQYREKTRAESDAILIGLSLGGMLAAQWVHEHPGDFNGVVLINSSCNSSFLFDRLQPGGGAALLSAAIHRDCLQQEKKIAGRVCNLADTDRIVRQWAEICRDAPMKTTNKLRQLLAAIRFSLPPRPDIPVLILCADNDRLTAPGCSEKIARLWNAPIIRHGRAGHDLPSDAPQWCADTILSWYEKQHAVP